MTSVNENYKWIFHYLVDVLDEKSTHAFRSKSGVTTRIYDMGEYQATVQFDQDHIPRVIILEGARSCQRYVAMREFGDTRNVPFTHTALCAFVRIIERWALPSSQPLRENSTTTDVQFHALGVLCRVVYANTLPEGTPIGLKVGDHILWSPIESQIINGVERRRQREYDATLTNPEIPAADDVISQETVDLLDTLFGGDNDGIQPIANIPPADPNAVVEEPMTKEEVMAFAKLYGPRPKDDDVTLGDCVDDEDQHTYPRGVLSDDVSQYAPSEEVKARARELAASTLGMTQAEADALNKLYGNGKD